jgi:hypothetical protein
MRAIRLAVAHSNMMLSSDSFETGTGSSNSIPSVNESPRTERARPIPRTTRSSAVSRAAAADWKGRASGHKPGSTFAFATPRCRCECESELKMGIPVQT